MVEALLLTVLLWGVLALETLFVRLELLLLLATLLLLGFLYVVVVLSTVRFLGVWVTLRCVTEVLLGVLETVRLLTEFPLLERTPLLLPLDSFSLKLRSLYEISLFPFLLEASELERVPVLL